MLCRNALWVTLLLGMSAACVAAEKIAPALDPASDARAEFRELAEQIASSRDWFARVAEQTLDRQALILPEDRDPLDVVLRRSEALLADLRAAGPRYDLTADSAALADARQQAAKLKPAADGAGPRYELYLKVCQLRRRIALANPLLDFDKILFVQRHLSVGHMCDQFYGHLNKKGGGLFVLDNAFSETPVARDLLAGAGVEKGRLAGKPLVPGSFLSPELSFDGRTVLFAYTQLAGRGWSRESCFHIFRVGADGKGLVQLTDGAWNEFDPCFLPDGRIAFISERRGGFLRCSGGRPCPVYTLYSMDADGQDITRMSHHETHEWQPSVDNDGKIVYTRWDYVDRDFNVAHHMWTCLPDGRDPRSSHGNYPVDQSGRPYFEADIRAIPGRQGNYIATAAAHHGQAFGSLVYLNTNIKDDDRMSQVRRITPEATFPELRERGQQYAYHNRYATAWPLSESYYLYAYDPGSRLHGLYLGDRFGNRELLYRHESVPSMSPIPLRPRPMPPAMPRAAQTAAEAARAQGNRI